MSPCFASIRRPVAINSVVSWPPGGTDARLARLQQHPEQGLGFIEEHVRQCTLDLQRPIVQRAMQAKADAVDENCPCCQTALIDKKRRVPKRIQSDCGSVHLYRTHGWCQTCQAWVFPADTALGLGEHSTASPLGQERCALLVSKMPGEQAEPVSARVAGIPFSRSTLAREAQRQGERRDRIHLPPDARSHEALGSVLEQGGGRSLALSASLLA